MKKLLVIITILLIVASCSTTKEAKSAKTELRNEKKLTEQVIVRKAVESGRYIIKLDRLYLTGGMIDLIPRANYIIIDGKKAIISAAYFGRQYDIRPIAGINLRGVAMDYELTSNLSKGRYEVKMKVGNGSTSFNLYLSIGKNGTCDASLTSLKIDNVRYRGYVVPIIDKTSIPLQNNDVI